MKRVQKYLLFVLAPGIIGGVLTYILSLTTGFYCPCGNCSIFNMQRVSLYLGIMGFSVGMVLGALVFVILNKMHKR